MEKYRFLYAIFSGLYVSSYAYIMYEDWLHDKNIPNGLKHRARAVVLFDRTVQYCLEHD